MKALGRTQQSAHVSAPPAKRNTHGYWDCKYNQRSLMEQVGEILRIKQLDEWYDITLENVNEHGALSMIWSRFGGSLSACLAGVFPHFKWEPLQFIIAPKRYWLNRSNQIQALERIAEDIEVKQLSDWYNVGVGRIDVQKYQAKGILRVFDHSITQSIVGVYSDYPWIEWKFLTAPVAYWQSKQNRRDAMDVIGKDLGLFTVDEFCNYSCKIIDTHGASGLSQYYNHSLWSCLVDLYPEFNFRPWEFRVRKRFWTTGANMRDYFEEIARRVNVYTLDDWHRCTRKELIAYQCFMFHNFKGSLFSALSLAYPKHKWLKSEMKYDDPRKITFWRSKTNQRQFLLDAQKTLNLEKTESWYRVSYDQIKKLGGSPLYKHWPQVISLVDPKFNWNWKKFLDTKSSTQLTVVKHMHTLLSPPT
mmetsp:Transcript_29149/g.32371  ORF Transcript_29149/g.32371 Transcript_29149/m.32371 type:complete len:417 (+) Transcript_29149:158-1408(+)